MNIIKISDSISKAYRQEPIAKSDIKSFRLALYSFYNNITIQGKEKNLETYIRDFLRSTFYANNDINKPNESDIDWAVRIGDKSTPVGIIIENKSLKNRSEMITRQDLNRKAMQELVYYYLEERVENDNTDIRHLIANNMYEFFIFDGQDFDKYFYQKKSLVKEFKSFKRGEKVRKDTQFFYEEIASKYIAEVQEDIPFTYFDLQSYKSAIQSTSEDTLKKITPLYRIFSDIHLLKKPFKNDNNSLNDKFYKELLHILGLEEIKEKGKKSIIRRLPEDKIQPASLLELTITQIRNKIYKLREKSNYGATESEQLYNIALELCITWINRILFLKLLESQLIKYHNGDLSFKFLTIDKIKDFDLLNYLFFDVLAVDYEKRKELNIKHEFDNVPYLNSSLFEETDLENKLININSLMQSEELPLANHSVLKKSGSQYERKKYLPTLDYLFAFLDAYNFSSEGNDDEIKEEPKTLISASVLGLIFEKINGHKDGAVFTPGYITMYMSHEAIRRTIIQKFNTTYKWQCKDETELYNRLDDISIKEANNVINSLKICDPAVGSGHFLVSVLNELICAKYELGILIDKEGKKIKKQNYKIEIDKDELIVSVIDEGETELFTYQPGNAEKQRIQETLFNEKRLIIENCLFGVDINPNSVNICRLRLWIELLKNAYYTQESGFKCLETLPNIDINIKCGNSVVNKYALNAMLNTSEAIKNYKTAVADYKKTSNKEKKYEIDEIINSVKAQIRYGLKQNDKDVKDLKKLETKLSKLTDDIFGFSGYTRKQISERRKEIETLKRKIAKKQARIEEKKGDTEFQGMNAFEWRFEFPEVLDDNGCFVGFDCIVTNPPYIEFKKLNCKLKKFLDKYETAHGKYDLFVPFIELSCGLLNPNGFLASINPTTFMKRDYGTTLMKYLRENTKINKIMDFGDSQIFPSATTYTGLFFFEKNKPEEYVFQYQKYASQTKASDIENYGFGDTETSYREVICLDNNELNKEAWIFLKKEDDNLFTKLKQSSETLGSICKYISVGIQSGKDSVFFIDDNIIERYNLEKDIIYPILKGEDIFSYYCNWGGTYVIYPYDQNNNVIEEKTLTERYPNIYSYLLERKEDLSKRDYFNNSNKRWYELWCERNYEKFHQTKIVNCEISAENRFAIDTNNYFGNTKVFCSVLKDSYSHLYRYITVLLNSKLMNYCAKRFSPPKAGGACEHKTQFIEKYPIRIVENYIERFNNAYNRITTEKDVNMDDVDILVYSLYNLSYDEVLIIDPLTNISRNDYESYLKRDEE